MRKTVDEIYAGNVDGRDVFRRGDPQRPRIIRKSLWTTTLHDVLTAFGDINVRKVKQRAHVIARQPVLPLESARRTLVELAPHLEEWMAVQAIRAKAEDARDAPRRSEVASFFSAALELTRDRALELRQDQHFSDVYVRRARELKAAE
jgi:segregation and condensation protein A